MGGKPSQSKSQRYKKITILEGGDHDISTIFFQPEMYIPKAPWDVMGCENHVF